jgi:hypothetical protein
MSRGGQTSIPRQLVRACTVPDVIDLLYYRDWSCITSSPQDTHDFRIKSAMDEREKSGFVLRYDPDLVGQVLARLLPCLTVVQLLDARGRGDFYSEFNHHDEPATTSSKRQTSD